ncbi:MAG: phosphatidate cytidylyltransferase [Chloroflexi bacterium]|nr:phosphatidate cytidylyltransferase [Chloroflexota bacterium]
MLLSRIVVAVIFIPLLLASVIVRGPLLLVVVVASTVIACVEFAWMFHHRTMAVPLPATVLVGLAYVGSTLADQSLWPWLAGALAIGVLWSGAERLIGPLQSGVGRGTLLEWARNLGLAVLGGSYLGFLVRYPLLIATLPQGDGWGVLALLSAWGADTGGYVVGRRFGRHALAPAISPRKTWEGVGGGLALAIVAAGLTAIFLPIPWPHVVPLGLATGVAAVVGDLLESAVKRFTGVKDASNLLAGHGGYLDRMDSLLPVLAVVYTYAVSFVER